MNGNSNAFSYARSTVAAIYGAVNKLAVEEIPLLGKEGWLRHQEMLRSHRNGADGVVHQRTDTDLEQPLLLASPYRARIRSAHARPSFQRRLRGILLRSRPPLLFQGNNILG